MEKQSTKPSKPGITEKPIRNLYDVFVQVNNKPPAYIKPMLAVDIDETVKELFKNENPDLIVVEQLKNMGHKSKAKRLLAKNIRRSIGIWNWKYWLKRLQEHTELNRVSFRSVSPYYTSQTCPKCGHTDRMNRNGEMFTCLSCGHTDNADNNAGINILLRFIMGQYGAHYKQDGLRELGFVPSFS